MQELNEVERHSAKVLDDLYDHVDLTPNPPICKVWDWKVEDTQWVGRSYHGPLFLSALRYADHPRLGTNMDGDFSHALLTSTLVWINLELGMARTLNTLYKLMGPTRGD